MKRILAAASLFGMALSPAACSPDNMVGVNPSQNIDLMRGAGSAARSPEGETTFRFVIPANAYAATISDPKLLQEQHNFLISSWVGSEKICPSGYTVAQPSNQQGMIIYTGKCH